MSAKRLRVSHLVIQPVIVWDDGEELEPGPALNPVTLPPSQVAGFIDGLPDQLLALAKDLTPEADAAGD